MKFLKALAKTVRDLSTVKTEKNPMCVDLSGKHAELEKAIEKTGIRVPRRMRYTFTIDDRISDFLTDYHNDNGIPPEILVETLITAYFQGIIPEIKFDKPKLDYPAHEIIGHIAQSGLEKDE